MDRPPVSAKTEELEQKIEARRVARAEAEEAQYAIDLEARIALEEEHGNIAAVKVRFTPGQPTRAYLKTPTPAQYKRFKDQVHRAVDRKNVQAQQDAGELLARSCWIYPDADKQAAMLDACPGLLSPISIAAAALAEGKAEEEGKG